MVSIDYTRDVLFDSFGLATLKERYLLPEENSPQEALARAATAFSKGDEELAQRIYDAASKHWFMFATPVLSNAPNKEGVARGLPISCFLSKPSDSRTGLNDHWSENTWLASSGGGIGADWSDVRSVGVSTSKGNKTTGIIPFLHVCDSQMLAVKQGSSRRAAYAAYLDISHPEIDEFIRMREPSGGDIHRKNLNLHHGVNIPDSFMHIIERTWTDPEADDSWNLVDPHSKQVVKTVSAKALWKSILTTRAKTGEPFLHFIDTTNNNKSEVNKINGQEINQSNLCSEIVLPTGKDFDDNNRTAVCCLSSLNLEKYDEWRDTTLVEDLVTFLDNVLDYFIENAPDGAKDAIYSASMERSLGIGTMGFHSYLQSKNVPFESGMALSLTNNMFRTIRERAEKRTEELGRLRGNAPDFDRAYPNPNEGTVGSMYPTQYRRNVYLMAVAPNASSSIICGNTSPSIEPFSSNAFSQKTSTGTNIFKNKHLDKIIMDKFMFDLNTKYDEKSYDACWKSIISNKGSVQHLDWLDDDTKDVFKTASELDQEWIIEHASKRQQYIDQSQSVNLFFPTPAMAKKVHSVHFNAWKKGLKTLYYYRTFAAKRVEDISIKIDRFDYTANSESDCLGCEG